MTRRDGKLMVSPGFPRITAEPPSLVGEQNPCFPNWLVSSQGAMEYDGTYFHLQVC